LRLREITLFVTLSCRSDEEIAKLGDLMSAAFRCSIYAHLFKDQKEQQRLFQIGLKAGRDLYEALKSRDPTMMSDTTKNFPGASTDFLVGSIYDSVAAEDTMRFHWSKDTTCPRTTPQLNFVIAKATAL
jgi:hypothetical protein